MQKFLISDENEIIKEGEKFFFSTKSYIKSIQNFINKSLIYFDVQFENELELVVDNGTHLVYNDAIIYKPICHLLNVDYKEMDKQKKFDYYYTMFQSKLSELSLIKTKEELLIKFPEIYSLYLKRKEQIEKAFEIYCSSNRVIPSYQANMIKAKYLQKYKIDEQFYKQLLIESSCFNIQYFINHIQYDMTNLVAYLPMIINSISSFNIDVNATPCFDFNKVSSILHDEYKLKR